MKSYLVEKRVIYVGFLLLLISALLIGCGSQDASNEETSKKASTDVIELNVNNWSASTHHMAYNVYEPWKELVEEKTDGRVQVNLYHGASLGKSSSVYQDINGGLYDVGLLATAYFSDTNFFPYTIGNLPFAFENSAEGAKVLKEFGEKYAKEELTDIIVMDPVASDPYSLFSTKPIKSVEDVKKTKIRVNGKSETELVKAMGGVPVSLSAEDTYEGLQKNSVEATFYSPVGAVGMKFFEPAPYLTLLNVSVTTLIPIMNLDFYQNLPDDLKILFDEELNPALTELFLNSYETELASSLENLGEAVAKRGEVITLPKEELEGFKEAGQAAWDAWIKDANDKGYDGEKMIEDLRSMIKDEK